MQPSRRFAFELALALGEANVDDMLSRMSFPLFQEWESFADSRSGISDVTPNAGSQPERKRQTPKEMRAVLNKLVAQQKIAQT